MQLQTIFTTAATLVGFAAAVPALAPTPTPAPIHPFRRGEKLQQVTMTLVNKMSNAVSTSVVSNADAMTLVSGGENLVGTMAPQATATFVATLGWSGNIALVEEKDGYQIETNVHSSLVEFGLTAQGDENKMDVDASYVNGYSVSATCHCNDDANTFLSGCPLDLWSQAANSTCDQNGEVDQRQPWGSCQNPYRAEGTGDGKSASPFFQPCQHKAYTYYNDDTANSNGVCLTGSATCCIGTEADGCSA